MVSRKRNSHTLKWKQSNVTAARPCSCKSVEGSFFFVFVFCQDEQTWTRPKLKRLMFFFNLKLKVTGKGFGVSQVCCLTPKFWEVPGPPHAPWAWRPWSEDFILSSFAPLVLWIINFFDFPSISRFSLIFFCFSFSAMASYGRNQK